MDRLLAFLLRSLVGADLGDAFVGDLVEHRRSRGRLWFWRAAAGMVAAAMLQRVASGTRAAAGGLAALPSDPILELRQAARALLRCRVYTLSLIAVMALSLAIAVTVFATVDGLLFRPLTYPRADQLYAVHAIAGTSTRFAFSADEIAQWRAAIPEAAFASFTTSGESLLEAVNEPGLGSALVDLPFFDVLGVRPQLGSLAGEPADAPPSDLPVLIGDELWARFGRDPAVLGRTLEIDPIQRIRFRIAGVLPAGFLFPSPTRVQVLSLAGRRSSLRVIARIPDRDAAAVVRQQLEALMAAPSARSNRPAPSAVLTPLALHLAGGHIVREAPRPGAYVQTARTAFTAMALLVLLACVNASALMAARATDRRREMAQRRAVGARSVDIARTVLAEIVVIMVAGLVLGLALAASLLGVLGNRLPEGHALMTPALGLRALIFAGLALSACFLVSSVWPIVRAIRADWSLLGRSNTAQTTSVLPGRLVAIAVQVSLGIVLTICGLLAAGSVWQVGRNDPGFDDNHLGLIEARISAPPLPDRNVRLAAILDDLLARIRSSPDVVAAGAADTWVLSGGVAGRMVEVNPIGAVPDRQRWILPIPVTEGFFEAAGLRLVAGRFPTADELRPGGRFVVVSASAAAAYWPGVAPLGREIEINRRPSPVIGVVADVRLRSWDASIDPAIYVPWDAAGAPRSNPMIFVRTAGAPARVLNAIASGRLAGVGGVRVRRAIPARTLLFDSIRERRLRSWAFGTFAAGALCIVSVGVFGLVAMSVGGRRREAGVRLALGATHGQIVRHLTRPHVTAVAVGLAAGLLLSVWAVQMVRTTLYGLSPFEPAVWAAAGLVVLTIGSIATIVPAHRAGLVDPAAALRE